MRSPSFLSASACAVVMVAAFAQQLPVASAFAKFAMQLPNGDAVPDAPAVGHPDAAGVQGLNEFGKDWNKLGKGWTAKYCNADSDGDGFTNGQELGDPCCTWTPTNPGSLITEGISHPSDKTKTPTNPKLQKACSTGGGTADKGTTGGASNSSATTPDMPLGTVDAGPEIPADDDEDDSSESAVLSEGSDARRATTSVAVALVSVACSIAITLSTL